jgi:outer membrane protein assembly factor BamB
LTVQAAPIASAPDVTTYHYDIARDGLNSQETILSQSNVNSTQFGKIGFDAVDGKVDAEPLYLANLTINGQPHNVLYIATEHGTVYAFDADTGVQLWTTSVLGNAETTSDDHNCSQITPEIGITATPVIDRKQGPNGTLFTVGMSKDATGAYHHRLHALDITTGKEITGSPTEITATYPGTGDNSQNGNVVFDPAQYAERAALLLLNGNIYMGWTSHCDIGLYTGWVMAYSESTLQQTQLLNLTPNGHEGSIWMSGGGIAADSQSNIYLLDANGTFDTALDANGFPTKGDYGNAMVKLSTIGKLAVADYFDMYNTESESNADLDLGSGGALLLPDQTDANGIVHHLIVGAGKDKNIYLADRDNLGKFNPATDPMDSNIYQQLTGAMAGLVYSTPAYFNGVLYYAADGDTLKAFPLINAQLALTPSSQTTIKFPHPGPTPSISANGTQNGIVWALESSLSSPGVLHAYDPANLAHEFYNSNQAANARDSFGNGNKFITPMIVNGKVYVGTQNGVAIFGLLPATPPQASATPQHSSPHLPTPPQ